MTKKDCSQDNYEKSLAQKVFFAFILCTTLAPTIRVAIDVLSGHSSEDLTGEGNPIRMLIYIAICAFTFYCILISRCSRSWWPLPATFTVAFIWYAGTALWGLNPEVGIRRLILTVVIVWVIFCLVREIGYERALTTLRLIFSIVLAANYAAVLLIPSFGVNQENTHVSIAGAWLGVLIDKNYAGPVCAFTIFIFAMDAKHISRLWRFIILAGATYFLYRTNSKTAYGLIILSFCLAYFFKKYNPYYRLLLIALIVMTMFVVAIGIVEYYEIIISKFTYYFEDPDSLTGRVQIWPLLWEYAKDNLVFGAGFGSFWNIGAASPIFARSDNWISTISSGHNGYLDLLVQVGVPGLMIGLSATVLVPLSNLILNVKLDRERGSLLVACFVFGIGHNLTESSLFERDSVVFVFWVMAVALLNFISSSSSECRSSFDRI